LPERRTLSATFRAGSGGQAIEIRHAPARARRATRRLTRIWDASETLAVVWTAPARTVHVRAPDTAAEKVTRSPGRAWRATARDAAVAPASAAPENGAAHAKHATSAKIPMRPTMGIAGVIGVHPLWLMRPGRCSARTLADGFGARLTRPG
jgi:hypothetical protein